MTVQPNSFRTGPDERGFFGIYGGRFVAETLMPLILELEEAWKAAKRDPAFQAELDASQYALCRPAEPALFRRAADRHISAAPRSTSSATSSTTPAATRSTTASARSCLPAAWARPGSSPRPAPASTAWRRRRFAARFGLPCVVYMGATDIERQKPNVFRMRLLGAELRPVTSGNATLKDAMNEALRDWVTNVETTYYLIGTAAGPHPYPEMVRDFQSVIGTEARAQILEAEGRLPDAHRRLHRRRLQRHRAVPSVPRRSRASGSTASKPAVTGSTSRTATPPR